MANKDILGRAGEQRAGEYFEQIGFQILGRNWRSHGGELDLIVARGVDLVVVEVKTRSSIRYGHPFEAIGRAKAARLWRLALSWCAAHPHEARGRKLRIDVLGLTGTVMASAQIEHLQDLV